MIKYIKENKSVLWFLGFLAVCGYFFVLKFFVKDYNVIHLPLDDKIPFLPIFILPYISWFAYVPGLLLLTFLKDKKFFVRQAAFFFLSVTVISIFFAVYPTRVDFRPTAEGKGFILWLCRFIFSFDTPPSNVLPSLHCFEATFVHLTAFTFGPYKKNVWLRIASAVLMILICLATMFVKQHSVMDVVSGCFLAAVVATVAGITAKNKGEKLWKK